VFSSSNNGSSWASVNAGLTYKYVLALAVSGGNIFAGTANGMFLSSNNGGSWASVNTGLPNSSIKALAVNGGNIFAGTATSGVFSSSNNGGSWAALNTGLPADSYVYAFAVSGGNIFAGIGNRVFSSSDNGGNWVDVSNGLQGYTVGALDINGGNILAGTFGGGVWMRPLSDITGIEEINRNDSPIVVYPNPARDRITIETPRLTKDDVISIYNNNGQLLMTKQVAKTNTEFDVSGLAKGIYIVKFTNSGNTSVTKFVKK